MTRTTIAQTGPMEVTLAAADPYTGEFETRVFWAPISGGYVREGAYHKADDRQLCYGLGRTGNTISVDSATELLSVIRKEWQAYRRKAERA